MNVFHLMCGWKMMPKTLDVACYVFLFLLTPVHLTANCLNIELN